MEEIADLGQGTRSMLFANVSLTMITPSKSLSRILAVLKDAEELVLRAISMNG